MSSLDWGEVRANSRSTALAALIATGGILLMGQSLPMWPNLFHSRFAVYLLICVALAGVKLRLPGAPESLSITYIPIVVAVAECSPVELFAMAAAGVFARRIWTREADRGTLVFQAGAAICSTALSYTTYQTSLLRVLNTSPPVLLFWATLAYFMASTGIAAVHEALGTRKSLLEIWVRSSGWAAPHYVFGTAFGAVLRAPFQTFGWEFGFLLLPGIHLLYRSHLAYKMQIKAEKAETQQVTELNLRTIEALALAIEAKDDTAQTHLRRLRLYCTQIAVELQLPPDTIKAIQAAALLHDVGKLAVPEYIIHKPGRLTREEFEKMKVHPVVGANILECVQFPYPVVPIVRSHHEKWDGSGYPDGLAGEAIPIGARILAVVDCLDALASDKQYRGAMPLEEALHYIVSRSGVDFDPAVVHILRSRMRDYEQQLIHAGNLMQDAQAPVRSRHPAVEDVSTAGLAAMSAVLAKAHGTPAPDFICSIAAARQEFQMLHEVTRDLGSSLSLNETFSLLASRLKGLVPHDTIAIYYLEGERLAPQHVQGVDQDLFSAIEIPKGGGLSGWVAQAERPLINGDPSKELACCPAPHPETALRSAISVPLEAMAGVVGSLTLYSRTPNAFSNDNLRILLAINSKVGLTIENAVTYRQVEASIGVDKLTGLINAHALLHALERRLAQSAETYQPFTVLVLDLDGFKPVNDCYGHLAGNEVLRLLGGRLRKMFRDEDVVSRMGGDEFVVILSGLTPEAVAQKREQLVMMVVEVGEEVCGERLLSVSIGESFYPADGTTVEELLGAADRRMYQMKQRRYAEHGNIRHTPISIAHEPY